MSVQVKIDYEALADVELARLIATRDAAAVRLVTTRNNQRLFRTAWSILKDRSEAEEAVQTGYLSAFSGIAGFEGRSSLATWLTRIVANEALGRLRTARRRAAQMEQQGVTVLDTYREVLMRGSDTPAPDAVLAREQIRNILERAVAALPDNFRTVFVLRDIEGLTVEETAEALGIPGPTVKTRLLRARRRLRQALAPDVASALSGVFPFAGADCEALTSRVIEAFIDR